MEAQHKSILSGSNRTFMELKLEALALIRLLTACSNRTFMELKSYPYPPAYTADEVLIVPLWN